MMRFAGKLWRPSCFAPSCAIIPQFQLAMRPCGRGRGRKNVVPGISDEDRYAMSISGDTNAPPADGLWARIRDRIPARFRPQAVKRWLATHLLPEEILYRLWRRRTARIPRSALSTASDLCIIEIQADMRLDIYWANRQLGPGPGASLF